MTRRVHDAGALGAASTGEIGPHDGREQDLQRLMLDALAADGLWRDLPPNVLLDGRDAWVVADCIDGRPFADGAAAPLSPRTAGASLAALFGLWAGGTSVAADDVARAALRGGLPVWVHDGCAANEAAGRVAGLMASHLDALDAVRAAIGCPADADADAGSGVRCDAAARLARALEGGNPQDRLAQFERAGVRRGAYAGEHRELVFVVNQVPGTTLDRTRVADAFGGAQAFDVDAWALGDTARAAARVMDLDDDAADAIADAMLDFALTAAFALGNDRMRIVAVS